MSPTTASIVDSNLADARAHAAVAEAYLSQLAADQPNTMTAIRLIHAATICAMATTNLDGAHQIVRDIRQHQAQEVIPHG